jgi:hypothetical protein
VLALSFLPSLKCEKSFKFHITTSLRPRNPLHLVDSDSDDGRQVFSFLQLLHAPSLHTEVHVHSANCFFSFFEFLFFRTSRNMRCENMVTFDAMLQIRQTAVFSHLLSYLVHSLRLHAWRYFTSLSPRCSNFCSLPSACLLPCLLACCSNR